MGAALQNGLGARDPRQGPLPATPFTVAKRSETVNPLHLLLLHRARRPVCLPEQRRRFYHYHDARCVSTYQMG
jgi:hypothetical protein